MYQKKHALPYTASVNAISNKLSGGQFLSKIFKSARIFITVLFIMTKTGKKFNRQFI